MSHIFLFGGVKIGSNTAFRCFVLQRKVIYSIKYEVYHIRRHVFLGENTILNKKNICNRTLSPYWKNDLPPTTKRFKGLQDNEREKVFFRTRRGSNYELVVFLGCKLLPIPLSDIRH